MEIREGCPPNGTKSATIQQGKPFMMGTYLNYGLFFAAFLLSGELMAQETVVPPYDPTPPPPAWDNRRPGFAPDTTNPYGQQKKPDLGKTPGQSQYPYEDDSYFVPVDPPSGGFDYFDDEEDPYKSSPSTSYGLGGAGGARKHEVKDSFKLLEGSSANSCKSWGNSLLGPSKFQDKIACEFELDKKVERGLASTNYVYDRIEFIKLRKVIRRELPSREEAKKYEVSFDSLQDSLKSVSRQGCQCLEK